ncbi:alpha/beta fold hydrolase [Mycobacterium sp. MYCO198283]|uniref:alpha/beta fold hydrolase n=1 Tax=Mycobacterium sp. MYCO198283 TaxID=2883505 RepID=UPI001E343259|nr:alpha/beta fold hydrolase [Mycobacterium sp. MYCO198283]MCG5430840.1 alpha/beta fold hydrolase [Mycobacterium sp. MYCO198283]
MTEPRWLDVEAPAVTLRALVWEPPGASADTPTALCLHGFPDTAHGWRRVAPQLVAAGWRVVAPFMRGYAPSGIPRDGAYHVAAQMHDALQVLDAVGPTGRDVLIGHDWGAIAATGIAALPECPFRRIAIMSVPLPAAFLPPGAVPNKLGLVSRLPLQLLRSWYILYFQLPALPDRSASWVVPLLWRYWSPGYRGAALEEDLRHVADAIGAPDRWRAALGAYRATVRKSTPPPPYTELHRYWTQRPVTPTRYLHGADDGCASPAWANWVRRILPDDAVITVPAAGHFLQLEQPDAVAAHLLDFIGRPTAP